MVKKTKQISTLGARATSVASVALVLVLLGTAALTAITGGFMSRELRRNVGFTLVLERESTEATTGDIKRMLMSDKSIERFTYTSADDILATESEILGDDIIGLLEANPYSGEFSVWLRENYASKDSMTVIAERYASLEPVNSVIYDSDMIEGRARAIHRAGYVLSILAAVLLIISVGLINNTVSLSVYGRRFIIHTMKLVGATSSFIRRPFILAALQSGIIAGIAASAVILAARWYAASLDTVLTEALPWNCVATVCVGMIVTGSVICCVTAYIAVCRYLRSSYDEMFMK